MWQIYLSSFVGLLNLHNVLPPHSKTRGTCITVLLPLLLLLFSTTNQAANDGLIRLKVWQGDLREMLAAVILRNGIGRQELISWNQSYKHLCWTSTHFQNKIFFWFQWFWYKRKWIHQKWSTKWVFSKTEKPAPIVLWGWTDKARCQDNRR